MAIPFENAMDRRRKPRIPCSGPVRLGPAHQPVRSTLVLEDLSSGGLFVRCPRPVQVGARFSIELSLPNGETLYVPEAEVIYNRRVSEELQGFGAEFVNLPAEVEAKLIDVAKFDSMIAPGERDVSASMIVYQESELAGAGLAGPGPRVSDLRLSSMRPVSDTEPPTVALRVFDGTRREDVSTLRVRKDRKTSVAEVWSDLGEAPALDQEIALETTTSGFAGELDLSASEAPPVRSTRSGRRLFRPSVLVAAGLCGFLVLGGVLFKSTRGDSRAYAEAAPAETNGLSAETHSMLTGRGRVDVAVKPAKQDALDGAPSPRNPLPELVDLKKLAAERQAQRQLAPPSTAPEPMAPTSGPAAKPSVPAPAAKPEAAKTPVKAAAVATAPAAKPAAASAAKPATSAPSPHRVDAAIRVSAGATVLRSFVLKSPPRFVVDVQDQSGVPEVTKGSARVGLHEGYTRIVVDSPRAISAGRVQKNGERLEIQLLD